MFDKQAFIKKNEINKVPFEQGLFITELNIKESFLVENKLLENSIKVDEKKVKINDESYFESVCLRVSFGIVDEEGNKVFTLEEIRNLKDKSFVDRANEKILEVNKPKK